MEWILQGSLWEKLGCYFQPQKIISVVFRSFLTCVLPGDKMRKKKKKKNNQSLYRVKKSKGVAWIIEELFSYFCKQSEEMAISCFKITK